MQSNTNKYIDIDTQVHKVDGVLGDLIAIFLVRALTEIKHLELAKFLSDLLECDINPRMQQILDLSINSICASIEQNLEVKKENFADVFDFVNSRYAIGSKEFLSRIQNEEFRNIFSKTQQKKFRYNPEKLNMNLLAGTTNHYEYAADIAYNFLTNSPLHQESFKKLFTETLTSFYPKISFPSDALNTVRDTITALYLEIADDHNIAKFTQEVSQSKINHCDLLLRIKAREIFTALKQRELKLCHRLVKEAQDIIIKLEGDNSLQSVSTPHAINEALIQSAKYYWINEEIDKALEMTFKSISIKPEDALRDFEVRIFNMSFIHDKEKRISSLNKFFDLLFAALCQERFHPQNTEIHEKFKTEFLNCFKQGYNKDSVNAGLDVIVKYTYKTDEDAILSRRENFLQINKLLNDQSRNHISQMNILAVFAERLYIKIPVDRNYLDVYSAIAKKFASWFEQGYELKTLRNQIALQDYEEKKLELVTYARDIPVLIRNVELMATVTKLHYSSYNLKPESIDLLQQFLNYSNISIDYKNAKALNILTHITSSSTSYNETALKIANSLKINDLDCKENLMLSHIYYNIFLYTSDSDCLSKASILLRKANKSFRKDEPIYSMQQALYDSLINLNMAISIGLLDQDIEPSHHLKFLNDFALHKLKFVLIYQKNVKDQQLFEQEQLAIQCQELIEEEKRKSKLKKEENQKIKLHFQNQATRSIEELIFGKEKYCIWQSAYGVYKSTDSNVYPIQGEDNFFATINAKDLKTVDNKIEERLCKILSEKTILTGKDTSDGIKEIRLNGNLTYELKYHGDIRFIVSHILTCNDVRLMIFTKVTGGHTGVKKWLQENSVEYIKCPDLDLEEEILFTQTANLDSFSSAMRFKFEEEEEERDASIDMEQEFLLTENSGSLGLTGAGGSLCGGDPHTP